MKELERLQNEEREKMIGRMADRFLGWRLPTDFHPDAGISFTATVNEGTSYSHTFKPVGTNLFTSTQAREMVRFILENYADNLIALSYQAGRGAAVDEMKEISHDLSEDSFDRIVSHFEARLSD